MEICESIWTTYVMPGTAQRQRQRYNSHDGCIQTPVVLSDPLVEGRRTTAGQFVAQCRLSAATVSALFDQTSYRSACSSRCECRPNDGSRFNCSRVWNRLLSYCPFTALVIRRALWVLPAMDNCSWIIGKVQYPRQASIITAHYWSLGYGKCPSRKSKGELCRPVRNASRSRQC